MPKVLIKDGDFVIAFDPAKITKVTSTTQGSSKVFIYGADGDCWGIDASQHPSALAQAVKILSKYFEVIDVREEEGSEYDGSTDVTYRFKKTGLSSWFKLTFPSQSEYDFAAELMKHEKAFKFKPWDKELYTMSVTFAPFYTDFNENRQLIYCILGEPVNAVEDY